jgi:nitroimidazol reductase NimA-like FMN-containing flavoprotein (pyridoxamine 5'-phosphate oxidase superfamily)
MSEIIRKIKGFGNMENKDAIFTQEWVQKLLTEPVLARLGTANPRTTQPHVTPVWFAWDGEALTISAFISTRKAREASENPRISVLIDTDNPTRAVLMEGEAQVITDPGEVRRLSEWIYARYVGEDEVKKAPYAGWTTDAENRVIKLRPEKVFAWKW